MIYLLKNAIQATWNEEASYNHELSMDRFIFRQGGYISGEEIQKPIIFDSPLEKEKARSYANIANDSGFLLINSVLVELLGRLAPEDVQFFRAEIRCKDGSIGDYQLVNIIHIVKGGSGDRPAVETMYELDISGGSNRIVLDKNCLDRCKIARLAEMRDCILVDREIKEAFDAVQANGIRFITPEDHYMAMFNNYDT